MELRQNSVLRISDEKTMELIDLYEKEQCLWNTALEDYKSRAKRHQAAERIARALNIEHFSSRYVIIKFKNLRNSYCQELKKVANSVAVGDDPPYRPKVFWFKKMDSYLRPHLHQSREPVLRLNHEIIIKSEPNETEELVQLSNPGDVFIDNCSDTDDDGDEPRRSRNSSIASKRARIDEPGSQSNEIGTIDEPGSQPNEVGRIDEPGSQPNEIGGIDEPGSQASEIVSMMKDISAHLHVMTSQKDDCFDSFGKYVAAMLRGMPPQQAMAAQPQIVQILVFGKMGKTETIIGERNLDIDEC